MTQFQLHRGVFWSNGLFIVDVLSRRPATGSATRTGGMSDEFQKWYCVFLRRTVAFSARRFSHSPQRHPYNRRYFSQVPDFPIPACTLTCFPLYFLSFTVYPSLSYTLG